MENEDILIANDEIKIRVVRNDYDALNDAP